MTATGWTFLTNHGRVLLCIARDPGMRLRDIAASLGITERSAFGIVTDLTEAGYIVKQRDGRRNRYEVQAHLPLREPTSRERTIGEMLALLAGNGTAESAGTAGPPGTAGPAGTAEPPGTPERAGRGT
ncbi:MAG: helix-turn-helix transcriptional regulator [Streptosporangiaceae bacterium]